MGTPIPGLFSVPNQPLKFSRKMISIDFETFSKIDIKKTGSWQYARDPSTEVLILCWSIDEGKTVHTWELGDPPPLRLFEYIGRGWTVRAFNSEFERAIWNHVCVPVMGWDPVPFDQWYDTMSLSYTHALPGKLEKAAEVLEVPVQKNKNGARLITKFCKPRKPTKNNKKLRNKPSDFPEDWELFKEYCGDDVRAECGVFAALPYPAFRVNEEYQWRMTCKTNESGIRLDRPSFMAMREMLDWYRTQKLERIVELTDGALETDGQRDKALDWLKSLGVEMDSYTKGDIEKTLKEDIHPDAREFLIIRQELGQVSTKKYEAMYHTTGQGDRTRNNMVYHRATTGRNGGSGLQLHNFPRDYVSKDIRLIETCLEMIRNRQFEDVHLIFGNPIDVAKGMLRSMIIPDEGEIFYCADFSSVENMGTVWIAQDPVGLDVFENGEDQYKAFAARQFEISINEVDDFQRTDAKATILGSMFGAGWKRILDTNLEKGIPMTAKQAKANVKEFREQYVITKEAWGHLTEAVFDAVESGMTTEFNGLKFKVSGDYLYIRLHSGRFLAYYDPRNEPVKTPWGEVKVQTTFMGMNSKNVWCRQTMTPSKIIENVVQATCRDLLMFSQVTLHNAGFRILLNVHDEILTSQRPGFMTMSEFVDLMVVQPEWVHNLPRRFPLKAEGYTAVRYKK